MTQFSGAISVNKFGRATNVDSVDTDIYDLANATDDQDIWVAPTDSRKHAIVSASANDTSAGTGARTIRIYGLRAWDERETYEDITMNGTTPVNTVHAYVIIHRMKVLTKGASGPNVGNIKATAATDSTITAQINAGEGQTQMAIYGIPSGVTAKMTDYYATAIKASTGVTASVKLLVNPEPDSELTAFLTKHTSAAASDGSTLMKQTFDPKYSITGPAIIKLQANASTTNIDMSGGFNLYLE